MQPHEPRRRPGPLHSILSSRSVRAMCQMRIETARSSANTPELDKRRRYRENKIADGGIDAKFRESNLLPWRYDDSTTPVTRSFEFSTYVFIVSHFHCISIYHYVTTPRGFLFLQSYGFYLTWPDLTRFFTQETI